KTSIICSPMTSLKTSIKTITYLSDIGCLEIQGASLLTASADDPLYVLFGKRKSRSIPDSYVLSGIREPAPQLMKVVHNWLSWLNRLGGRYCSDVMDVSPSALVLSNLC
ncbi:hypothetical protein, partial [Escherichia coli]|uniref:hypothetical protein n=1 Tax=Escherichia coli TaxID=562 RepID=UPI0025914965